MGRYRGGEAATDAPFLTGPVDVIAYAAYRMPATYAAVRAALAQVAGRCPTLAPTSLLDLGGGTGAAAWAVTDAFPGLAEVTVVDQVPAALDAGPAAGRTPAPGCARRTGGPPQLAGLVAPPADVVTVSYVLGELTAGRPGGGGPPRRRVRDDARAGRRAGHTGRVRAGPGRPDAAHRGRPERGRAMPAPGALPDRARTGLVPLRRPDRPLVGAPPDQAGRPGLRGREVRLRRRDPVRRAAPRHRAGSCAGPGTARAWSRSPSAPPTRASPRRSSPSARATATAPPATSPGAPPGPPTHRHNVAKVAVCHGKPRPLQPVCLVLLNCFDAWCNIDAVATVGNRVATSSAGWGAACGTTAHGVMWVPVGDEFSLRVAVPACSS